jgi:hypothetical protein
MIRAQENIAAKCVFFRLINELQTLAYQLEPQRIDNRGQVEAAWQRLNRLEDLYLTEGGISKENYLKRRGEIIKESAQLEAEQKQDEDASELIEQILSSFHNIHRFEDKEKKALINNVFQRLEITNGQIHSVTPQD